MKKHSLLVILVLISVTSACSHQPAVLEGYVVDNGEPIPGAHVRVQASSLMTTTDSNGYFVLYLSDDPGPLTLTAWSAGYFITALEDATPNNNPHQINIFKHNDEDHPDYQWVSPFSKDGDEGNCENCHSDSDILLPFEDWSMDAHARSSENPRFLSLYKGTDLLGNKSPETRYIDNRDYGLVPLPPNPALPYYGPGYKLDFPDLEGNCAACHLPGAAINAPYQTDPIRLAADPVSGIHCDFCHKIWDVYLDPISGLPYENYPGVLSYEYRRPGPDHQFFAGPFDDVAPGEDTYSPIQSQSEYCAGCHFGSFWSERIYNSYGEWLQSPYNSSENGQTCQDCHMPISGINHFADPDQGGLIRDPTTIRSHDMLGISDKDFMENAVSVRVIDELHEETLRVKVEIYNDQTGHKIPTDSPLRNMLLVVQAQSMSGEQIDMISGPRLPAWAGEKVGDPGHFAGLPGKGFALILQDKWTGSAPTFAYWNPVLVIEDSRLAPYEKDLSVYVFDLSEISEVQLSVKLIFRRAFIELAEQKGWGVEDTVIFNLQRNLP